VTALELHESEALFVYPIRVFFSFAVRAGVLVLIGEAKLGVQIHPQKIIKTIIRSKILSYMYL
jgi:hypothetical protein